MASAPFLFTHDLYYGLTNNQEVLVLQQRLASAGCFNTTPTGNFGPITRQAVICFQTKYKFSPIPPTGYVGPYTRQVLNQLAAQSAEPASAPAPTPSAPPPSPTPQTASPSPAPTPPSPTPSQSPSPAPQPAPPAPAPIPSPNPVPPVQPAPAPVNPAPSPAPITSPSTSPATSETPVPAAPKELPQLNTQVFSGWPLVFVIASVVLVGFIAARLALKKANTQLSLTSLFKAKNIKEPALKPPVNKTPVVAEEKIEIPRPEKPKGVSKAIPAIRIAGEAAPVMPPKPPINVNYNLPKKTQSPAAESLPIRLVYSESAAPPPANKIPVASNIKVWKTIKFGAYKNVAALLEVLTKKGKKINDYYHGVIVPETLPLYPREVTADLALRSVADLGFEGSATYQDIRTKAKELGLLDAPAEAGPQLRLQYADQPKGEVVIIAMEPVLDFRGEPVIFSIENVDGEEWLNSIGVDPGSTYAGYRLFAFVRPR